MAASFCRAPFCRAPLREKVGADDSRATNVTDARLQFIRSTDVLGDLCETSAISAIKSFTAGYAEKAAEVAKKPEIALETKESRPDISR